MKKMLLLAATALVATAAASAQTFQLSGAGATFPQPLYVKMFDEYKAVTGNEVNYQGIGSGAGVAQLTAKTVDFGASDAPMNAGQIAKAGADVVHIPTCVGAIVITYNLPGKVVQLRLTGSLVAEIYMQKITKWNDPALRAVNPGVNLPNRNIVIVHRADASGTSYNFTGYLSKESPDWARTVGQSTNPKWPVGLGGKGNPGVAAQVKQIPFSIGYVEIAYALQTKMPTAIMKNKAGHWIDPHEMASVGQAANIDFPADGKADLIDSSAAQGYPISTTTWLLVYKDQTYTGNQAKSQAVMKTIWWMLHDGQQYNEALGYAKLPAGAVAVAETLMKSVTYHGTPLLH